MLKTSAIKAYFLKVHGKSVTGKTIAEVIKNGADATGAVSGMPAVTAADNGKVLKVVNGAWAVVAEE